MPRTTSVRARSDRLARNNDVILDTAVRIAATEGWTEFTAAAVARQSGLSKRPVLERHPTRQDLASAVWSQRCGPAFREATMRLIEAEEPAEQVAALTAFARPSTLLKASAELLTVAQFDEACRNVVVESYGRPLAEQILPNGRTTQQAAVRAYLVSLGLGLLWIARTVGSRYDLTTELTRVVDVLAKPEQAVPVPDIPAEHLHLDVFRTGDAIRDAVLTATLEVVSEVGFEAATTARIAKQANVSEGALFARFPTKLALFVEATDLHAQVALRQNEAYQQQIASAHGRGVAEAILLREFMRPGREYLQRLNLEQLRVGWHDIVLRRLVKDRVDDFIEHAWDPSTDVSEANRGAIAQVSLAVGTGVVVTSLLVPESAELPYSVVTVPLEG